MTSTTSPLERGVVDSLIVAPALLGLVWSAKEWFAVGRINVLLPPDQKHKNCEPLLNRSEQFQNMNEISSIIAAGAKSFLKAEYLYMAAYIVLFSGVLLVATEWKTTVSLGVSPRSKLTSRPRTSACRASGVSGWTSKTLRSRADPSWCRWFRSGFSLYSC